KAQEQEQRTLADRNEKLAEEKGQLAEEKGRLADRNEKLADEKGQLAEERGRLADDREHERAAAEKAKNEAVVARNEALAARKLAEDRGHELRRNLYFSEMNLAAHAIRSPGGVRRTQEILALWSGLRPDQRDWEWYYLNGMCHREIRTLL